MGQKGDEKQLLGFLNAVLGRTGKEQIESVEILENTSFLRKVRDGKSCVLDVLAVLQDGTRVNVEVQLRNEHNMDKRSLFYWSKVYQESLERGQDYKELPDVIAVNIVGFDFPPGGGFHTCFHLREDKDPTLVLSALEIHFINMLQWRKLEGKDVRNDPLHCWLAWLDEKSSPKLVEEVVSMNSDIKSAYEKYAEAIEDKEAYQEYWAERKFEHDMASRINGARRENSIEIARNALAKGISPDIIHEITGLDMDAIKNITMNEHE
jgi:predicted transposase/invertase (TIGR01784 family)